MQIVSSSEPILGELYEKIVKSFLDVLILSRLRRTSPLSGYDLVTLIHRKFQILISPGTVYSVLYALEREGLIEGTAHSRKRLYQLSKVGEGKIASIIASKEQINAFICRFFLS